MRTKKRSHLHVSLEHLHLKKMSFGLCNAPATFQRCMLSIFCDMVEHCLEVFMDDLIVFENSFDDCLDNLEKVLKRCVEKKTCVELGKMSLHGYFWNCFLSYCIY